MTRSSLTASRGFTLIELLVVVAIIAILAGLILQTAGFIQKKAARSRADAEIAALSAALESYKADFGVYPEATTANPNTTAAVGNGATTNLVRSLQPSTGKVYFEFSKNMTNATGDVIDPFGEVYGYRFPGVKNGSNFFDLWSRGATTNTEAWSKNW